MILITNGTIYPMSSAPIENGAILIDDNKIKRIYKQGEPLPNTLDNNISLLDAEGGWILPGIIESHCHIGITEDKKGIIGEGCNEYVDPVTPYLCAIDGINPMDSAFKDAIRAGITSVMVGPGSSNPIGGQFIFMKTHGKIIDDMVVMAPAAMKIAFGENPIVNFGEQDKSPVTRMGTAATIREEIFRAMQYKEEKEQADSDKEYFKLNYQLECWMPVLNKEIPLKAHAHRADDIMTSIRIAKEFDLDLTLDHCTEGYLIAERLAKEGYPAIVGPNLTFRNKIEMENMGFETAGVLADAGVTVSITTDHPVCLIQSLAICAGLAVRAGLDLEEGLRAITINAAMNCNVDDRVGSLQPGLDADIAIFDGNPMQTFTNTLYTIIDGELVYDYKKEK